MSNALFSTAYLPPAVYFMKMAPHKAIFIEQHENYQKQSYRNRCRIAGPNGPNELYVPVEKQGQIKVCIKDLRISYVEPWQKVHWRTLQTAYNNSPFFLYYQDKLEPFYQRRYEFLLDFNTELLLLMMTWLNMRCSLHLTDSFILPGSNSHDYRYSIHPKTPALASPAPYHQVFEEKYGFIQGLSALDLIFNTGPESSEYIKMNM